MVLKLDKTKAQTYSRQDTNKTIPEEQEEHDFAQIGIERLTTKKSGEISDNDQENNLRKP